MKFDLHTIWAREADSPDAPWLIDAWDEFTIDDNQSGWLEALEKARATTSEMRVVIIRVDHESILAAFAAAPVIGEVVQ